MLSMTGYGKGISTADGRTVTVELKSVNNRYLEVFMRVPRGLGYAEDIIRNIIRANATRGSFDVFFQYDNKSENSRSVRANIPLAREYYKAAKAISTEFVLENDVSVLSLMRLPEVMSIESSPDEEEIIANLTRQSAQEAMKQLNAMRKTEGESIAADLAILGKNMISNLAAAKSRAPEVVTAYQNKLSKRIQESLQQVEIDKTQLLNEVAFFADKADINEELSRLMSHLEQYIKILKDSEPVGRKLDFLSQEMLREVNTIGSKSNDLELTSYVLKMKNEVEKIKEQIRNVE